MCRVNTDANAPFRFHRPFHFVTPLATPHAGLCACQPPPPHPHSSPYIMCGVRRRRGARRRARAETHCGFILALPPRVRGRFLLECSRSLTVGRIWTFILPNACLMRDGGPLCPRSCGLLCGVVIASCARGLTASPTCSFADCNCCMLILSGAEPLARTLTSPEPWLACGVNLVAWPRGARPPLPRAPLRVPMERHRGCYTRRRRQRGAGPRLPARGGDFPLAASAGWRMRPLVDGAPSEHLMTSSD